MSNSTVHTLRFSQKISAHKLYAFLKRDFLDAISYKFYFISSVLEIFFSSATFFFISKLISGSEPASLSPYGGDYFSFVIIGVAFSGILGVFQRGLQEIIRKAQLTGTLEALLVTRTNISTILVGSSLFSFIFALFKTLFQLGLAISIFDMHLGDVNWLGTSIIFILTSVCFVSIGVLSASFILVYKLGNPFGWVFGNITNVLGGVFFPIAVLPSWIKWISYLLPITYSLEGFRQSLLSSASLSQILPNIIALLVFSVTLLPLSFYIFRAALLKAKRDGSLTHY
jgi:ABC-2 type transport system permease protein